MRQCSVGQPAPRSAVLRCCCCVVALSSSYSWWWWSSSSSLSLSLSWSKSIGGGGYGRRRCRRGGAGLSLWLWLVVIVAVAVDDVAVVVTTETETMTCHACLVYYTALQDVVRPCFVGLHFPYHKHHAPPVIHAKAHGGGWKGGSLPNACCIDDCLISQTKERWTLT